MKNSLLFVNVVLYYTGTYIESHVQFLIQPVKLLLRTMEGIEMLSGAFLLYHKSNSL